MVHLVKELRVGLRELEQVQHVDAGHQIVGQVSYSRILQGEFASEQLVRVNDTLV